MLVTEEWKKARLERAYSGELNVPENMNRATQALFWEFRQAVRWEERGITPTYNLGRKDKEGTLSMYQIYMQCDSEYEAAMVLLGNYQHWEKLLKAPWFIKKVDQWRREKLVKDAAMGRGCLVNAAANGNVSAAKYLDQLVNPKPSKTKGPSTAVEAPEEEDVWMQHALNTLKQ